MGKVNIIQSNFSSGELTPRIALGRMDIAKYANGSKRQENIELTVQGGARRRKGTRLVCETKASGAARLIEFTYNRDQSYMLEFGNGYVRFMRDRAPILSSTLPYEIASPYTTAMLSDISYVQGADTMFLVHPDVPPYRLQRFGDTSWQLLPVPFTAEPFAELGFLPTATLTLSALTIGAGRNFSAAGAFLQSDVGREIVAGSGVGLITAYVDVNNVTVTITSAFPVLSIASGVWRMTASPQGAIASSAKEPVGASVTLGAAINTTLDAPKVMGALSHDGVTTASVNVEAHGYATGNLIKISECRPVGYNGTFSVTVTGADNFTYVLAANPGVVTTLGYAARQTATVAAMNVWRPGDVGKFVRINDGLIKITSYTGAQTVTGTIQRSPTSVVPAIPNSWSLESSIWGGANGYPRAVTLHEQRLHLAGSPGFPQTLCGSRIGDYLNFELGVADDDAFSYELSTSQVAPIQHLAQSSRLLVFTASNEMTVRGGVEKPITPTNIQKKDESTAGTNSVRPVKIGNEIMFVQRAGRKLRSIGYRYDIDGFSAPDRTVFAEHITQSGITDIAFQQEPDALLFCVRADGQLAVCAYEVEQEVVGWGRWITQGLFQSVANIPTTTAEDVYVVVQRTINGAVKRFIEVFDANVSLDLAVSGTDVPEKTVWTGLTHLNGMQVQALADGAYMGIFTVAGGQITLPRAAFAVQIGLAYTALVETLQIEIAANGSSIQGQQINVNEVALRTLNTKAVVLNGIEIDPRKFGAALLDQPPPDFIGDIRIATFTDDIYKVKQVITQPYPLPFHLLDIVRVVTVNG